VGKVRDWKYYLAKTWMTTLYFLLGIGAIIMWIYLVATDPTLRMVAAIVLGIAVFITLLNLLFKLTEWSENILEDRKSSAVNKRN
jgi:cytochrome c biogenesis protein CcdA